MGLVWDGSFLMFVYFDVAILKVTDSLPFPCAICRNPPRLSDSLSSFTDQYVNILIAIFIFLLMSSGASVTCFPFFPGFLHFIFLCPLVASSVFIWPVRLNCLWNLESVSFLFSFGILVSRNSFKFILQTAVH